MTQEHNGFDRVTWRDLDAMRERIFVELDRRLTEQARQHDRERAADRKGDQEALRLARNEVKTALARTNEFRQEATEDKERFADKTFVVSELAKTEANFKSELAKIIANQSGTNSDIRILQNASNVTKGRDLGLLSLAASVGGGIVYGLVQFLS